MPTCLVVQHVEAEEPYAIGSALEDAGISVDVRRVHLGDALPADLGSLCGLVVMGGPMSAHRDEGFPTRRLELALLERALTAGLPTLGVCLGAQLLALAGGGDVYPGAQGPEIGWAPVALTPAALDDPLLSPLPATIEVLHWHGDTFDLPPGSIHLATSERYRSQAFRSGARAWGLQFHLEVNDVAVGAFVDAFGSEAASAGMAPARIRAAATDALARLEPWRDVVLEGFAALVSAHDRQPSIGHA